MGSLWAICNGTDVDTGVHEGTPRVRPPISDMGDYPSSKGPGTEYDALQRLFAQVFPLLSEFVPSGQVVSYQ